MSIEALLTSLIAAVNANTAALQGKAAAPAAAPAAPAASAAAAAAPASTGIQLAQVQAKGKELMEKKGKEAFVAVLTKHGAKKLSDVKADAYAAFVKDIDAALAAEADPFA